MSPLSKKSVRLALAVALITSCVSCDQMTKEIASQRLRGQAPRSYLADTVRLQYTLNPGAFLSLGSQLPTKLRSHLLICMNAVMLAAMVGVLAWKWQMAPFSFIAIVLLLAGCIGNLTDRIQQYGYVTDFINLGVGPLRTGIFNVADVAITAGALILLLTSRGHQPAPCPASRDANPH